VQGRAWHDSETEYVLVELLCLVHIFDVKVHFLDTCMDESFYENCQSPLTWGSTREDIWSAVTGQEKAHLVKIRGTKYRNVKAGMKAFIVEQDWGYSTPAGRIHILQLWLSLYLALTSGTQQCPCRYSRCTNISKGNCTAFKSGSRYVPLLVKRTPAGQQGHGRNSSEISSKFHENDKRNTILNNMLGGAEKQRLHRSIGIRAVTFISWCSAMTGVLIGKFAGKTFRIRED
jgi:hypothetical protein